MHIPTQQVYAHLVASAQQEAGRNLAHATPSEAGSYAVHYLRAHIKHSVNLDNLRHGGFVDTASIRQITMQHTAGTLNKQILEFNSQDFINLASAAQNHAIGNCGDLCMVAARVIVENGYPYPVELCTILGRKEKHSLDHAFLRIHSDPHDRYTENVVIDPLVQMLSPAEQNDLMGRNQPITFKEPESNQHLFCYVVNQETKQAKLLPMADIADAFVGSLGHVSLNADRKIEFIANPAGQTA